MIMDSKSVILNRLLSNYIFKDILVTHFGGAFSCHKAFTTKGSVYKMMIDNGEKYTR